MSPEGSVVEFYDMSLGFMTGTVVYLDDTGLWALVKDKNGWLHTLDISAITEMD